MPTKINFDFSLFMGGGYANNKTADKSITKCLSIEIKMYNIKIVNMKLGGISNLKFRYMYGNSQNVQSVMQ